jgi:hypothetical protein
MGNSDLEKNFVTANDTCVRDPWNFAFGTDPDAEPYQKLQWLLGCKKFVFQIF